jgi:hypothetical protein
MALLYEEIIDHIIMGCFEPSNVFGTGFKEK